MKKEDICVLIDSEEQRLIALDILKRAGEKVAPHTRLRECYNEKMWLKMFEDNEWYTAYTKEEKTIITLDQLEELIGVHLTIDELKKQAEKLGFELVEKKREIKVGDFGVFYNNKLANYYYGFLSKIEEEKYWIEGSIRCNNFRHLTNEEKEKIQNNW